MTSMQVSCSRSAHDENVLARRPQWDLHGCHSQREKRASLEGALMRNVLAWNKSASRRARGWAGEKIARSEGQPRPRPILGALIAMAHDCVVAPTRISEDTKLDLL
jgi:hypothetical protein